LKGSPTALEVCLQVIYRRTTSSDSLIHSIAILFTTQSNKILFGSQNVITGGRENAIKGDNNGVLAGSNHNVSGILNSVLGGTVSELFSPGFFSLRVVPIPRSHPFFCTLVPMIADDVCDSIQKTSMGDFSVVAWEVCGNVALGGASNVFNLQTKNSVVSGGWVGEFPYAHLISQSAADWAPSHVSQNNKVTGESVIISGGRDNTVSKQFRHVSWRNGVFGGTDGRLGYLMPQSTGRWQLFSNECRAKTATCFRSLTNRYSVMVGAMESSISEEQRCALVRGFFFPGVFFPRFSCKTKLK
jgi:hypothetical protein